MVRLSRSEDLKRLPISVIIPVHEEFDAVKVLLNRLSDLNPKPSEVLFVLTGKSVLMGQWIGGWVSANQDNGLSCRIYYHPGAYPGTARNKGIRSASQEWIAFLDTGLSPATNWLGELWEFKELYRINAVYGTCYFRSDDVIGRMVCVLSYGLGKQRHVLPASLFHRSVLRIVGSFKEQLRSGEDILWNRALKDRMIPFGICWDAKTEYTFFPKTLGEAMKKYFIYEQSATAAGLGGHLKTIFYLSLLVVCGLVVSGSLIGVYIFLIYLILRGVIDPIRRSNIFPWWCKWWQPVLILPVALLLDLSAAIGRVFTLIGVGKFRAISSRPLL